MTTTKLSLVEISHLRKEFFFPFFPILIVDTKDSNKQQILAYVAVRC